MEKKLNIFFSNSISAHKWGGGEKWMVTAAKGLNKRGHKVTPVSYTHLTLPTLLLV